LPIPLTREFGNAGGYHVESSEWPGNQPVCAALEKISELVDLALDQIHEQGNGARLTAICYSEDELINQFVEEFISKQIRHMTNVISALTARTQLGQILKRASEKDERFLVDRRGKPSVIIMSIKDYIKNIAPTPPAYQAIREDARNKGTNLMSMREIDREIVAVRKQQAKKKSKTSAK